MAELLKGAPVAAALNEQSARRAAELNKQGTVPVLAIVRVGARPDDMAYETGAIKRCEKIGVNVRRVVLPENISQDELLEAIRELNSDPQVHGVLLLRPLPKSLDERSVCNALAPEKDVDGITDASLAGVFTGTETGYPPCTPQACIEILDYYGVDPKGKRAVVAGRSLVVGKPVAMMLLQRNATVTVCHTRTENMPEICRDAEILVVAAGHAKTVGGNCLSPNQIVLDVGINMDENGKLCGDVDSEQAEATVKAFTPVPGGVGTVTASVLAKHVVIAAEKATARNNG
jgi:methylenetetrahydrofolate dehydrogenase (NADP+)/methenyltetrahydrofolate cyclohydrolase